MATKRALTALEKTIYSSLKKEAIVLRAHKAESPDWTERFCNIFNLIASNEGYLQWHKGTPKELLWDITWTKRIASVNGTTEKWSPVLSCEMEWNGGNSALEDFRKLPLSSAPNKIMIFDREWIGGKNSKRERGKEKLSEMIKSIPHKGSNYLFILVKSNNDNRSDSTFPVLSYSAILS